jgi:hypothetical protein
MAQILRSNLALLPFSLCKTAPKKSKMPPFGGLGTIDVSHCNVNKTRG